MRTVPLVTLGLLAIAVGPTRATAQLSLELRMSAVEATNFSAGARDMGFAGDVLWDLNESFSIFAGYNEATFTLRNGEREDFRSSGFQAGARATLLRGSRLQPWVVFGVVRNTVDYEVPRQAFQEESDATLGPLIAAGLDIPLTNAFTLSPGLRRQSFRVDINEEDCGAGFSLGPPSFCDDVSTWGLDLALRIRVLN